MTGRTVLKSRFRIAGILLLTNLSRKTKILDISNEGPGLRAVRNLKLQQKWICRRPPDWTRHADGHFPAHEPAIDYSQSSRVYFQVDWALKEQPGR